MAEKPNYYAVVPAEVRYDADLTEFEKLLYAEIIALTDKTGYCWASNNYFAKLFEKTPSHISRSISNLNQLGYVCVIVDSDKGNTRRIEIGGRPIRKNIKTIDINADRSTHKAQDPIRKNDKHINTSNNNQNEQLEERKDTRTFDEIIHAFTGNQILKAEIIEFVKMRKMIRAPLTNHSLKLLLTQKNKGLFDLARGNENTMTEIVMQSIANSWKGFFPLRQDKAIKPTETSNPFLNLAMGVRHDQK